MAIAKSWWATMVGTGLLTCAASLVWGYPAVTFADGPEAQLLQLGGVASSQAKIGGILLSSKLASDPKRPGKYFVEVDARNDTPAEKSVRFEAEVTAVDFQPMARVMPMPKSVWSQPQNVTVGSGEKTVQRIALPDAVCRKIAASKAAPKKAAGNKAALNMPLAPRTQFNVRIRPING